MANKTQQRDAVFAVCYEFYNVTDDHIQERVKHFIETFPWAEEHANLVFVYIRTVIDYKVVSQLNKTNDIRLRNSMVNSINNTHKQLFSYSPKIAKKSAPETLKAQKEDKFKAIDKKELEGLFNPMSMINSIEIDNNENGELN